MARETLIVDRRRTVVGFLVLLVSLAAVTVVLVRVHGRAVRAGYDGTITTAIEILSGIVVAMELYLVASSIVVLRRSIRLKQSLRRAIQRDAGRAIGGNSESFADFGELGAAIGAYGRTLQQRSRTIVGRLVATETAIRQLLSMIDDEIVVFDGAGRVFASSSAAERLLETDTQGTSWLTTEPPIRTVLRSLLAEASHEPIRVGKLLMHITPVFVEQNDELRSLAYVVLSRREGIRRIEPEPTPVTKRPTGFFRTVISGLRPGGNRR